MKSVIEQFYQAFARLDAEAMLACYHNDIRFEDPAFGVLIGEKAKNMWRMLCHSQKGKDFRVKASNIECAYQKGSAQWEAFYTFSKTGRHVHNVIQAEFEFKDNKIIRHTDHFDLYRWSRQALGWKGYLLGWTPFFKQKLHTQTHKLLSDFEQRQSGVYEKKG